MTRGGDERHRPNKTGGASPARGGRSRAGFLVDFLNLPYFGRGVVRNFVTNANKKYLTSIQEWGIIVYNHTSIKKEEFTVLEISNKTNLLEQKQYRYQLQDVEEPNLYRDIYDYENVPKIAFNHRRVPMNMPPEIWITDTSFRDGQQSVNPYTVEQIVELFKLMSRLGGPPSLQGKERSQSGRSVRSRAPPLNHFLPLRGRWLGDSI